MIGARIGSYPLFLRFLGREVSCPYEEFLGANSSALLREAYLAKWRDDNNPKPGQSTVASDSQRYVAPRGHSGSIEHFHDFFTAVRTRGGTIEDATFGHNAAMGCHMANHAYFNNTIATWDSAANKIRG